MSLVGFVIQFVGLRGLHWSISIAQLLAILLATALRICIRMSFSQPHQYEKLRENFELEWCTYHINDIRPLASGHGASTGSSSGGLRDDASRFVNTRIQLGDIAKKSGWQSSFIEEAQRLHETINEFMYLLWSGTIANINLADKSLTEFRFEIDLCPTRKCTVGGYPMIIRRSKLPGMFTTWSSDLVQLEAFLALWVYELQQEADDTDITDQEPFDMPQRCVWKCCTMSAQSAVDFDWWIRRGYTYYKTPRATSRRPLTSSDKPPTAESTLCDNKEDASSTQLLTVATQCSVSCLCARYIFAAFLEKVLQCIVCLNGKSSIRLSDDETTRELIRFQNSAIETMSTTIASRGLISLQDSYTLLIPALRHARLLPTPFEIVSTPIFYPTWV